MISLAGIAPKLSVGEPSGARSGRRSERVCNRHRPSLSLGGGGSGGDGSGGGGGAVREVDREDGEKCEQKTPQRHK